MKPRRKRFRGTPRNVICVSDLHCGCKMGLYPNHAMRLDGCGSYAPSPLQRKVWSLWREFWDEWVPVVTKREPFILVVNGDALDGRHHGSTTQISQDLDDQQRIAEACLAPIVARAAVDYHILGTEAHVGPSGENEKKLARALGAKPDKDGRYARWELWLDLHDHLIHFTHHIGTTGTAAYESTAVLKELIEAYTDAGRWKQRSPQAVVRSHRHRHLEVRFHAAGGPAVSMTTPGWQLKTPFTYKLPGARQSQPQIGGVLLRAGDRQFFTDSMVWSLERPKTEVYHD